MANEQMICAFSNSSSLILSFFSCNSVSTAEAVVFARANSSDARVVSKRSVLS